MGCTLIATFGTETTKSTVLTSCFKKGTIVKTLTGEKTIEEIKKGDKVWTVNGWEEVITPTLLKNKTLIRLKTRNSTEDYIDCTPEHEFLTISKKHRGRIEGVFQKDDVLKWYPEFEKYKSTDTFYQRIYGYWRESTPQWKKAKDIDNINDYGIRKIDLEISKEKNIYWENNFQNNFGIGISKNIPINNDLCELIGMWLAEGSSNGCQLTFTIHQEEEAFKKRIIELMWKIFQLDNYSIYRRKQTLAMNISYSSKQLIKFFEFLFEVDDLKKVTQWNKYVPKKLMHIDPKKQMQIFKGWFIGDGWASKKIGKREAKGTTVSKKLANDMVFILNRNFINPFIQKEDRTNKKNRSKIYNIMFYRNKAEHLRNLKYYSDYKEAFYFNLEERTAMDFPLIYQGNYFLKTRLEHEENIKDNLVEQNVYCLKVPSKSFTVNDTLVHNCRGYRSRDYPDGIDVDTAQYIAALIKQERGFLYSLEDTVYGNEDKDRKPNKIFIKEVEKYPGLLDIMFGITGLINKRSSHASGVIMLNEDPYDFCCFMKTPTGEIISQWDLHDLEYAGGLKFDLLVTEVTDKIGICLDLLVKKNVIDNLPLRERYNKYLHPKVIDINKSEIWDALAAGDVIDCFQFSTDVGLAAAKKLKPRTPEELVSANALMRLMAPDKNSENPLDKYKRFKENFPEAWEQEMNKYGITKEEKELIKDIYEPSYGCPSIQEDLMILLMKCANFTLAESNSARSIVGKKKMSKIPELHDQIWERIEHKGFAQYLWDTSIKVQLGYSFNRLLWPTQT